MVVGLVSAALVAGVPDSVTADVCYRATDAVKADYDPKGPIFHHREFMAAASAHHLDDVQTLREMKFCMDYVIQVRALGQIGRKNH